VKAWLFQDHRQKQLLDDDCPRWRGWLLAFAKTAAPVVLALVVAAAATVSR
jgi:hypothetical protein